MSKLNILQCDSLNCDNDLIELETFQSTSSSEHILKDYNNIHPNYIKTATNQPYVNFRDGFGIESRFIDNEQREGKFGVHKRDTNQLFTRPFLTIPYMGKGKHNVDQESDLLSSETTAQSRQCNSLAGVFLKNQFTPLVQTLRENVQNPIHIIPEDSRKDWFRGGIDTTQIRKDIDYFSRCLDNEQTQQILIDKKPYLQSPQNIM